MKTASSRIEKYRELNLLNFTFLDSMDCGFERFRSYYLYLTECGFLTATAKLITETQPYQVFGCP